MITKTAVDVPAKTTARRGTKVKITAVLLPLTCALGNGRYDLRQLETIYIKIYWNGIWRNSRRSHLHRQRCAIRTPAINHWKPLTRPVSRKAQSKGAQT